MEGELLLWQPLEVYLAHVLTNVIAFPLKISSERPCPPSVVHQLTKGPGQLWTWLPNLDPGRTKVHASVSGLLFSSWS